jgi:hypothetical protein
MQLHLPLSILVVFHHLVVEGKEGEIQREEVVGEGMRNRGNCDAGDGDVRSPDDGNGVCHCFCFYFYV